MIPRTTLKDRVEMLENGIRMSHESINTLRAERDAARQQRDELREAARPFAACVFNDNGDVTLSTGRLGTLEWLRLDRAVAAADKAS